MLEIHLGLRHAVAYREKRESAFVLPCCRKKYGRLLFTEKLSGEIIENPYRERKPALVREVIYPPEMTEISSVFTVHLNVIARQIRKDHVLKVDIVFLAVCLYRLVSPVAQDINAVGKKYHRSVHRFSPIQSRFATVSFSFSSSVFIFFDLFST